jgi:hypothetical protein
MDFAEETCCDILKNNSFFNDYDNDVVDTR